MRLSLRRRALIALGLAVTFVAGAAAPAQAAYNYSGAGPWYERDHRGVGGWAPQILDFNSGYDTTARVSWMVFGFEWDQAEHKLELTGNSNAFEINAEVNCTWARTGYAENYTDGTLGLQGYTKELWDTNVPAAALPYEDTIFNEPCATEGSTGRGWFGVGVLNAKALTTGHYYIRVSIANWSGFNTTPPSSSVQLRTKANTVYDSTLSVPSSLQDDCSFRDDEIANWNNATSIDASVKRKQAAWCSWNDWTHDVTYADDGELSTGQLKYFSTNKLWNQGMEEAGTTSYGFWPAGNQARYCNVPGVPAYDGNCFIEWNGAGIGGNSIYQDVPWTYGTPGANGTGATGEAMLRCRSGGANCSIGLSVVGTGGSHPTEQKLGYVSIPNSNTAWWRCRIDYDHLGGNDFAYSHDTLRLQIWNDSATNNVDIDYTFLGGKTRWRNPNAAYPFNPGVGTASVGYPCTQITS